MKPHLIIDIHKKYSTRLNLNSQRVISIPVKFLLTVFFIPLIILFFVFGSVTAPTSNGVIAAQNNDEQRKALESQLAELENQISQYETTIKQYKTQGKTLQGEIKRLETQIAKLSLQIKAISLTLSKLDTEINSTQAQINRIESDINFNKKNLSQTLQTLYENDNKSLVEILFTNPKLSDFFTDLNNLLAVQDNLRLVIIKIAEAHQKLIDQKEVLALGRADAAALKAYQDSQKTSIQKTQTEKGNLL
ncbi:MAG: hypothetical protein GW899_00735, partial [Parcubacteria group bacterium]|nr:hypothetical protein [Parcubacteria group bacterium]